MRFDCGLLTVVVESQDRRLTWRCCEKAKAGDKVSPGGKQILPGPGRSASEWELRWRPDKYHARTLDAFTSSGSCLVHFSKTARGHYPKSCNSTGLFTLASSGLGGLWGWPLQGRCLMAGRKSESVCKGCYHNYSSTKATHCFCHIPTRMFTLRLSVIVMRLLHIAPRAKHKDHWMCLGLVRGLSTGSLQRWITRVCVSFIFHRMAFVLWTFYNWIISLIAMCSPSSTLKFNIIIQCNPRSSVSCEWLQLIYQITEEPAHHL